MGCKRMSDFNIGTEFDDSEFNDNIEFNDEDMEQSEDFEDEDMEQSEDFEDEDESLEDFEDEPEDFEDENLEGFEDEPEGFEDESEDFEDEDEPEGFEDESLEQEQSESSVISDYGAEASDLLDPNNTDGLDAEIDFGVAVGLDESGLKDDEQSYDVVTGNDSSFIGSTGDIVVQDREDRGENFKLRYIDISNIAISRRIRQSRNVESLIQSIKSTGLLKPIVVAPLKTEGLYVLIDGYRRILACARAGLKVVPCVVNTKINTPDIPIIEALYNHSQQYSIKEMCKYIEYLEKEKGIMSASMIEYLLQMNSGDYTKLKDILNDDDDDIVTPLLNDQMTIAQAFKKLEQRRKKETKEEQEARKTEQVYGDAEESGAKQLEGSGEEASEDMALTEEEIKELAIGADEMDNVDSEDLDEMVETSNQIDGFEPNKQDYRDREILDPALRKSVLAKYNNTCQCCQLGGQEYIDVLDVHHKVEVYLGGDDSIDNLIPVCLLCHKMIHLFARGELYIRPSEELKPEERDKFKRIVVLGNIIRKGMAKKNMKREDLKKVDKAEKIGRAKPGIHQVAG